MDSSKRKENKKQNFFSEDFLEKRLHKVYLIIALIFGIGMSVALPFFTEPDGQYHYVVSSNIAGLTNDITVYGEGWPWYGQHTQPQAYQSGNLINKYYATKIKKVDISSLPRASSLPSIKSYDYLSHLLPALGVWLGYHIYPSMGMMIVTGRLLSMFVCSLAMFFIIKYLKRGKLFFMAVSLSPTIMNAFSSLSYDATSYVFSALIIALSINAIVNKKLSVGLFVRMAVIGFFSFFILKTNLKLLVLLFPLVLLGIFWKHYRGRGLLKYRAISKLEKRFNLVFILLVFVLIFAGLFVLAPRYGGIGQIFYHWFINLTYNFNQGANIASAITTGNTGYIMPYWLIGVWFILLFVCLLAEEKFVDSQLVGYGALALFFANIVAVTLSFMYWPMEVNRNIIMGYMGGIQGRYFTPFFLLLPLFMGNQRFVLKLENLRKARTYRTLTVALVLIVSYSNFAWIFNNLFNFIFMRT